MNRSNNRRRCEVLLRIINEVTRAAQRSDHSGENFKRTPACDRLVNLDERLFPIRFDAGDDQHFGAQAEYNFI